MIITTLLLMLTMISACGTEPIAEEKAIADASTGQSLGLHKTTVDDKTVYQFMLCDRLRIAEQNDIDKSLSDSETCYNPLVDTKGQPFVLTAEPTATATFIDKTKKVAGKASVVVGAGVLVATSIVFGIKSWKVFVSVEDYFKHSRLMEGIQSAAKKKLHRVISWFKDGKATSFFAAWFLVGDGAFIVFWRILDLNKFYYNNGKKVLFDWGKGDKLYRDNFPYLVNNDWRNTKKVARVHYVLDAIRKDLGSQFNERYRRENPIL